MSETTVHVRASRADIRKAIGVIPTAAKAGGATANVMMTRCGMAALGFIKQAFIVKARGGTDEGGVKWKPLAPATIAYRRRHPGLPPAKQRAASRPSWMLTEKQRNRWWELCRFFGPARAWMIIKSEGAVTIFDKYSTVEVDILRDTGLLLNSLSPGIESEEKVFRVKPGEVIVGTNREGALDHHEGRKNCPQRRLWPEPNKWPSDWWQDITTEARAGLTDLAILLIRGS